MIKRRSIVYKYNKDDHFTPYGRVWKISGSKVTVIDCCKNIDEYDIKNLVEVANYKGYIEFHSGRLIRMPSLRKLKQMASFYHPEVRAK